MYEYANMLQVFYVAWVVGPVLLILTGLLLFWYWRRKQVRAAQQRHREHLRVAAEWERSRQEAIQRINAQDALDDAVVVHPHRSAAHQPTTRTHTSPRPKLQRVERRVAASRDDSSYQEVDTASMFSATRAAAEPPSSFFGGGSFGGGGASGSWGDSSSSSSSSSDSGSSSGSGE